METKNCRIVGEMCSLPDKDFFLASIELEEAGESTHLFVSLIVMDDDVQWRVDDYDHCRWMIEALKSSESDDYEAKPAIENHCDFEATEKSPYRIFFCMLENLWNVTHTTYHLSSFSSIV